MKLNKKEKYREPFFIVGNSRSGTTLIARILSNNPRIHVLSETHIVQEFVFKYGDEKNLSEADIWRIVNEMLTIQKKGIYRKREYEEHPEKASSIISIFKEKPVQDFSALISAFFESEAQWHGKIQPGDQTPNHIFHVYRLMEIFPKAKFIHMVRDPRAVLLSQKRKWKGSLRWGQPKFEVLRTRFNYHPITTTLIWKKAIEAGQKAQRIFPDSVFRTIAFESFIKKPEEEIESLCKFLGVKFNYDMLNVNVELSANREDEGKRGISASVSERWINELSKSETYLCEVCAGSIMETLGYKSVGSKPNLLIAVSYILLWPLQLSIAFLLNLERMGNPITYVLRRFQG